MGQVLSSDSGVSGDLELPSPITLPSLEFSSIFSEAENQKEAKPKEEVEEEKVKIKQYIYV
jgi:hypothetical protein